MVESTEQVVEEMMRIHRSLPPRPGIEEVEAAKALIRNVEKEEQSRVDGIDGQIQSKSHSVSEELLLLLKDMQKELVYFHGKEQKREALKLLDLEAVHALFDEIIQRASHCLKSQHKPQQPSNTRSRERDPVPASKLGLFTRDDSYFNKAKAKASFFANSKANANANANANAIVNADDGFGEDGSKLSLIKLASLIEVTAKKGALDLNLQAKLMDQIEWLPDSIGKLSRLVTLDLSDNRIVALPHTIGSLSSLKKLDLHSNRVDQLPDSFGDILSLGFLDLSSNQLSSLPATFGRLVRLEELDLSSNCLPFLPDSIGSLVSLKKLNVETNDIEEIPHTIGHCSSLKELRADYNRLKALPEAVGKIETLEVLSVRYNNIKQLPTTMSSLATLKELDVSFNELESVPESLCFATTLVKMNIGNNFDDLKQLPRSIGNLEMLEELDISNNQIRVLPGSFRMLTHLQILRVEENPLEVPPRHVVELGAKAVVQYMADLVEKRDVKSQPLKQKKSWAQLCFFSKSKKRKRNGMDYVKA